MLTPSSCSLSILGELVLCIHEEACLIAERTYDFWNIPDSKLEDLLEVIKYYRDETADEEPELEPVEQFHSTKGKIGL
jgi:hypothetical protein